MLFNYFVKMVMVVLTKNIDSYTIYYYQGKDYEAEILCYFDNKNVGAIRFFNDHGAIRNPPWQVVVAVLFILIFQYKDLGI